MALVLNKKALNPNSFERQNVKLALKLFSDKNIAALKVYACKKGFDKMKGTIKRGGRFRRQVRATSLLQ